MAFSCVDADTRPDVSSEGSLIMINKSSNNNKKKNSNNNNNLIITDFTVQ